MLANLKLQNRILLGYTLPIILFIGLAVPVFSSANKVEEAFKQTKISTTAIEKTDEMAFRLAKMVGSVRGYLVNQNEIFLRDYQDDAKLFRQAADAVERSLQNSEQKNKLTRMIEIEAEYNDFANSMINLVKQGRREEALNLFSNNRGVKIIEEFNNLNSNFNKQQHILAELATARAEANLNFLIQSVVGGAFLCTILALITAFLISSGIAKKIYRAIAAIASSSTEIAATIEQQERTAAQQAVAVNQTTTTMDELGASSRASTEQAEAAVAAARQVLILVNGTYLESAVFQKDSLKEKIEAIAQQILRLSDRTNQISSIIDLVNEFSNQTNMLALNAAVEAVRAGEHGKGFGVVAAEIRKLADKSKQSTERIKLLVEDIRTATNSTVMVTDEGTKTLESIVLAMNNVVVSNQQISLNAKQQAIAIGQVVDAMNLINQGAVQTASAIGQTKVGTIALNEAALNLKSVV